MDVFYMHFQHTLRFLRTFSKTRTSPGLNNYSIKNNSKNQILRKAQRWENFERCQTIKHSSKFVKLETRPFPSLRFSCKMIKYMKIEIEKRALKSLTNVKS